MEKKWFVYILECNDGSFYTGVTNDIESRMKVHVSGKGSRCVAARGFKRLLKSRECGSKSEAFRFECEVKGLKKSEKLGWFG